jgi:flagellar FliL protein
MAEENNEAREEAKTETKKKSSALLILTILFAILLIGGAAAGYFFFMAPQGASVTASAQPAAAVQAQPQVQAAPTGGMSSGPMKKMDSFIVNLTDAQGTRYLKVIMQLEMSNDMLGAEIDRKTPQIRDEIIMLLSSKSFDDISTIAGKRALKRGILNSVNKYLVSGRVLRIYFSDFVVQ